MSQTSDSVPQRAYRFPSGVTLRILSAQKEILAHFDGEYGSARADDVAADIEVYAGKAAISASRQAEAHRAAFQGRHKIVRWRVSVSDVSKATTYVGFEGSGQLVVSFLQTFYVEPLLRLKIAARDHALVHAACVAKAGRSVIFPAGSAVGKSTLTLRHAASGEFVQGDNYVILTPDGRTLAFPRRMRIYSDLPDNNPDVYRMMPRREQLRLRWAGIIRRLSLGYSNMPRRLALEQVLDGKNPVLPEAQLDSVYLLAAYEGEGLSGPVPRSKEDAIERIQEIGAREGDRLREALSSAAKQELESATQEALRREREVLAGALDGVEIFELLVPRVRNPLPVVEEIRRVAGLTGSA
jgi:hypothetical protein